MKEGSRSSSASGSASLGRTDRSSYLAPKDYIISVCVVCGAHAVYPFSCGHRSETEWWTVPIVVKPSGATRRAVQAAIDREEQS